MLGLSEVPRVEMLKLYFMIVGTGGPFLSVPFLSIPLRGISYGLAQQAAFGVCIGQLRMDIHMRNFF